MNKHGQHPGSSHAHRRPTSRVSARRSPRRRRLALIAAALALSTLVSVVVLAASYAASDGGPKAALVSRTTAIPARRRRRHPAGDAQHHGPLRLAVHVGDNELLNAADEPIRLVGVDRSGTQYMCVLGRGIFDGPSDSASIAAMKSWRINAVRVPINEDCWLGINGVAEAFSGTTYRNAIEAYVAALNRAGLYVIVDVHWSAPGREPALGQQDMLDASHGYTLWRSLATTFKSNPAVLFDLYNEPHGLGATAAEQWRCWAAGCGIYAGMDGLVSTIRSAGARNVILLAGLDWASDDSGWLRNEPHDPLHQLAAAFHLYRAHTICTTESCWNQTLLPLAAHVPVVDDEFGEMQCGEPSALAWLRTWMSYATRHGFSMLAWSWNAKQDECSQGPLLIDGYDGTPTPYGATVMAFFLEH
jgi:endoglucanase